jgi:modulator of FtsH protease
MFRGRARAGRTEGRFPMQNMSPFSVSRGATASRDTALPFLRRVYLLLTAGIGFAIAGALSALYLGSPVALGSSAGGVVYAPPAVALAMAHPFLLLAVFFGAFFAASFARNKPGLNLVALFGFTFITGLWLAPTLFVVQAAALQGTTLDPSPIRDAFLLTGAAFTGLTGYALVTKKDFSFMRAALSMGLWVLIGASILGIFLQSAALNLAISSVAVLVFGGFILHDTSRLLRGREGDDAVGAALGMFLNVLNLFMALLNILSSRRR